ncbi:MAG: hypothetical protein NT154_05645 [Verrucomicrobia bacterium]|nr:hypothetical protein [Verrucomicrobiota bacterium]
MKVLHLHACPVWDERGRPTSASPHAVPTVLAFACLFLLWPGLNTASAASGPVLNGPLFLKITTTNSGLQTLSATALANVLGQSPADISAAIAQGAFSLTNHGQPVHWLPSAAADALLFYGEVHRDNYSYQNVYWLTQSTNLPSTALNGRAPAANASAIFYPAVLKQAGHQRLVGDHGKQPDAQLLPVRASGRDQSFGPLRPH